MLPILDKLNIFEKHTLYILYPDGVTESLLGLPLQLETNMNGIFGKFSKFEHMR